jgi:RNA polymerase sigma factor (sigma-70 family)
MDEALAITTAMSADRNKNITHTIRAMSKRLFDFIRQRVGSTEDAEDILQDVFYQLAGNTEPIEQVSSWLFKVTRNKITDSYRKQKLPLADDIFPTGDDGDESFDWREMLLSSGSTPETDYMRNIFWQTLQEALAELPEEQRTAFIQNEIDGIPFKEIAAATGESMATLISRKRYAVLHLRERLTMVRDELLNY